MRPMPDLQGANRLPMSLNRLSLWSARGSHASTCARPAREPRALPSRLNCKTVDHAVVISLYAEPKGTWGEETDPGL